MSEDLRSWVRVGDVVAASGPPALDDLATWTGSVVGDWHEEAWRHDRAGQPMLLAFLYFDQARQFLGELSDPMPVGWENGVLKVTRTVEA